jgi:hypothetical protein
VLSDLHHDVWDWNRFDVRLIILLLECTGVGILMAAIETPMAINAKIPTATTMSWNRLNVLWKIVICLPPECSSVSVSLSDGGSCVRRGA